MLYLRQFPTPPGGGVTSSLLAFKIALNSEFEDIPADQIIIKIELYTELQISMLLTLYDENNTGEIDDIRKNYIGFYYIEFGEYPQSQETNSTIINAMGTTVDSKGYYTSSANGRKYARKGTSPNFTYYLVEPVRWLVVGNGANYNDLPNKNYDNLGDNQLLLLSEKIIDSAGYHSTDSKIAWTSSKLFTIVLPELKSKLFNAFEQSRLATINDNSQLSILSYDTIYNYLNYGADGEILKAEKSDFTVVATNFYLLRTNNITYVERPDGYNSYAVKAINSTNSLIDILYVFSLGGLRPIIIFDSKF